MTTDTVSSSPTSRDLAALEARLQIDGVAERGTEPAFTLAEALDLGERLSELGLSDRKRALHLAERFARLARFTDTPGVEAVARRARGHAMRGLRRYREALRDYDAASRGFSRAGLPLEQARTCIGTLDVFVNLGLHDEAIALARRTRRMFQRAGEPKRAARLEVNLANLYLRRDRPGLALARYRAAERVFATRGDVLDLALTRFNMANLLVELGRLREALPLFAYSGEQWLARGSESARLQCRFAHAAALSRLGRFPEAMPMLEEVCVAAAALGEPVLNAMGAVARARIAMALGRVENVEALLTRAIEGFSVATMRWDQAEALVLRAQWRRRVGSLAMASQDLETAARLFEGSGQRSLAVWADLERARLTNELSPAAAWRPLARRAIRLFHRFGQGIHEAEARLWLAEDALDRGVSGALAHLAQVRRLQRSFPDPWLEQHWTMLSARASIARPGAALRHLERAAAIADSLRARIPTETLRAALSVDQHEIAERAIELILSLDLPRPEMHALLWSERAHVPRLRIGAASNEGGRPGRLLDSIRERRTELERIDMAAGRGLERRRQGRRNAAVASLQQLYERLHSECAREADQARLGPSEIVRLQRAVGPRERLIEYFVGRRAVHVFVVGRGTLEHHALAADVGAARERAFRLRRLWDRHALAARGGESRRSALRATESDLLSELAADLLEPVLRGVGADHLTIVPHQWLRDVPFHALTMRGVPLAARSTVGYMLSARERLPIAIPTEEAGPPLVIGVSSPEAPSAEEEAREVAAAWPGATLLCGIEASPDTVRPRWPRASRIHIAAHATREPTEPRLSGVRLGRGSWTSFDVTEVGTRADLVVLSGCRTGDAVVWGGDEAFGLLPALVHSGAGPVVVSLWPVDDDTARLWMRRFNQALATGRSAVGAWTHATGQARADGDSAYHWAPFVLYGRCSSSEVLP